MIDPSVALPGVNLVGGCRPWEKVQYLADANEISVDGSSREGLIRPVQVILSRFEQGN